ncbi:MAG: hypothetical protein H8D34_15235 [Chloroflexi bacterium]|nr:hypothetical protein [Chloroflexota bacterium]
MKASKNQIILRIAIVLVLAIVAVAAINEGAFFLLKEKGDRAPETVELIIPEGTAERVAQGEQIPAIPEEMVFVIGDVLKVVNRDSVDHQLGPIWVPAGASGSIVLEQADKFAYRCSFQASRYLGLDVRVGTTVKSRVQALLLAAPPTAVFLFIYSLLIFPIKENKKQSDQFAGA